MHFWALPFSHYLFYSLLILLLYLLLQTRPNQPTNQLTIPSLTSTDVENCNVVKTTGSTSETSNIKNIRNIKKSRIRKNKCRKSEMGKSEYQNIIYLQENAISGQWNQPNSMKWLFGSFKNAILCLLNTLSWTMTTSKCWETFCTIMLRNIKSIQQT